MQSSCLRSQWTSLSPGLPSCYSRMGICGCLGLNVHSCKRSYAYVSSVWREETYNRNDMCSPLFEIVCLPYPNDTVLPGKARIVVFVTGCTNVWISPIFPLPFHLFFPFISSIACFILEVANVSGYFFSGITIAVGLWCSVPRPFMFQNGAELLCHSSLRSEKPL